MKTISKVLGGAVAVAALSAGFAAPAAAQYYPGNGGVGNVVVGAVLDSILRGSIGGGVGYGAPYGSGNQYGYNQQSERYLIDQCARAAEQRFNQGYNQNGGFRVNQIDRIERTRKGNLRVWGTASTAGSQGNYGGYGQSYGGYGQYNGQYGGQYGGQYNGQYGNQYNGQYAQGQQRFSCKIDNRGRVVDLALDRGQYGYNNGRRY